MAVSFVGAGATVINATPTQIPALPTGLAVGDVLVLIASNSNSIALGSPTLAITIPSGWDIVDDRVNSDSAVGGRNHLLIAWKRVDVVARETAPAVIHAFASGQVGTAQVIALRGVSNVAPVVEHITSSSAAAQNIGPFTGLTIADQNAVLVVGHKANDWSSVDLLTGDGLTWSELSETTTTTGDDMGIVLDFAINSTGSPVAVTAKTFTVTGGQGGSGLGMMIEFVAGSPTTTDYRTWSANRIKETTISTGTGNITPAGAVSKYRGIGSYTMGDLFPCLITDAATGAWEKSIARRNTSTAIERVAVIASSNAGARVNFAAGEKSIVVPSAASDEVASMLSRYGDGSDGDLTVSGVVTATKDMNWRELVLTTGAALNMAGFLASAHYANFNTAPANAIHWNGGVGGAGGAGSGTTGGAAGTGGAALVSKTLGGCIAGGVGTIGLIGVAGSGGPASPAGTVSANGGRGGHGGQGGAGTSATNPGGLSTALTLKHYPRFFSALRGVTLLTGGAPAVGGGCGRGDGTNFAGGGSGGGGSGAGTFVLRALVLSRGASTAVGAISAKGGVGGAGGIPAPGATAKVGAGAGGGGGGGGWIFLDIGVLAGSIATSLVDASGGNGGNGANGANFDVNPVCGGQGGYGGGKGSLFISVGGIIVFESAADLVTIGADGAVAVGNTGGGGGLGGALQANL